MPYSFLRLDAGPRWFPISEGHPRLSSAHAAAIDYFRAHGFAMLVAELDTTEPDHPAWDYMVERDGAMVQFVAQEA